MRKTMVMVAATAMVMAGCGGSGKSSGSSSGAGLSSAVTDCLKAAGFKHDPNLATVGLEGADPVFASDGVTIYTAKSSAAAGRIARAAKASEAEGSEGRRLYLSRADQAAKVRACLKD